MKSLQKCDQITELFQKNGYTINEPCGKGEKNVKKYSCDVCGWEYDEAVGAPDRGIAPGTKFEVLPEDFVCPLCGVGKDQFSEI